MDKPVQLTLWLDEPDVMETQCPRCGHKYNNFSQAKRYTLPVQQIMAHAKIQELTKSQRDFLRDMPDAFLGGEMRMGVTEMGDRAGLSAQGAQYHVRTLAKRGVFLTEPKREGGRYRVYRFAFPNGAAAS